MNVRKLIRTLNLSFGIALILAINVIGALPRILPGVQHPVGPEIVSVYISNGEPNEMLTPVKSVEEGFKNTGQRVCVYLVNRYKDDSITFYPRWTLVVALAMAIIHTLTLIPWKPRTKSAGISNCTTTSP